MIRVLIAEDHAATRDILALALEELGFEVRTVESGAELVTQLADGHFDLVITDVMMPWVSGLDVLRQARRAGLRTAFLVITGLDDESIAQKVAELGPDAAFLQKPFGLENLEEAIAALFKQRQTQIPSSAETTGGR